MASSLTQYLKPSFKGLCDSNLATLVISHTRLTPHTRLGTPHTGKEHLTLGTTSVPFHQGVLLPRVAALPTAPSHLQTSLAKRPPHLQSNVAAHCHSPHAFPGFLFPPTVITASHILIFIFWLLCSTHISKHTDTHANTRTTRTGALCLLSGSRCPTQSLAQSRSPACYWENERIQIIV